jgi:hypothetical protein
MSQVDQLSHKMSAPTTNPNPTHNFQISSPSGSESLQQSPQLTTLPQPPAYTSQSPSLLLNFSWKKLHVLVQDDTAPSSSPLYSIAIHTTTGPHILLRTFPDGSTIGTGTLHLFSITPDISIHGRSGRLRAQKRFRTDYSYLSYAYSDVAGQAVTLRWKSASGFVAWDFLCVDGEGNTVARFEASVFNVSKVARVEFMGPKAWDAKFREEVLLVGLTLYYCMVSRTYNVFNIFGSVFLREGPERSELKLEDRDGGGDRDTGIDGSGKGYIVDKETYGPKLNISR